MNSAVFSAPHQVDCTRSPALQLVLEQVWHVELRCSSVGDLLLRPGPISSNTFGWRGETCREGVPDGGARGMSQKYLRGHEKGKKRRKLIRISCWTLIASSVVMTFRPLFHFHPFGRLSLKRFSCSVIYFLMSGFCLFHLIVSQLNQSPRSFSLLNHNDTHAQMIIKFFRRLHIDLCRIALI